MIYVELLINREDLENSDYFNKYTPNAVECQAIKDYIFKSLNSFLNKRFDLTRIRESSLFFFGKYKGIIHVHFENSARRLFQLYLSSKNPF